MPKEFKYARAEPLLQRMNGALLGHQRWPAQLMGDAFAQAVSGCHLSMHHEHLTRSVVQAAQPGQGLIAIGMGGS